MGRWSPLGASRNRASFPARSPKITGGCSAGRNTCLQRKHSSHPTILPRRDDQDEHRKPLAEHNIGGKEVMLIVRISLERHDFTATRAEWLQNAKHRIFRFAAYRLQEPRRQRPEFAFASERCLEMKDPHLAENATISVTDTSRTLITSTTRTFRRRRNFEYYVGRLIGWPYYREPRGTPRQRLHFNFAVANLNGKRIGAHGMPHHLIYVGDFGFLGGIPENRQGCTQNTHKTNLCFPDCSQVRAAQLMRLVQELHCHLCAPKVLSSGVSHVSSIFLLSRAFLHEHFIFSTYPTNHTPRTLSTSRKADRRKWANDLYINSEVASDKDSLFG